MAYSPSRGAPGGGRTDAPRQVMPEARPVVYFKDGPAKKALDPALLVEAERFATEVADVAASQLRRFYSDVTAFERRLQIDSALPDAAVEAQMGLLKAQAVYAAARDSKRRPLLQFFVDHAASVKDRKDFQAFRRVFETVIAFHKFHETKQNRGD